MGFETRGRASAWWVNEKRVATDRIPTIFAGAALARQRDDLGCGAAVHCRATRIADAALLAEGSPPYPVIELIRRHHLDCPAQFVAAPGRQCRVHRSQAVE